MGSLFRLGDFALASGSRSSWKIECDALTADDWRALAAMAVEVLPPFARVVGVPRGGWPFMFALQPYAMCECGHRASKHNAGGVSPDYTHCGAVGCGCHGDHFRGRTLLAEDVATTGGSITRFRDDLMIGDKLPAESYFGVCAFARGACPGWVTPLFRFAHALGTGPLPGVAR